MKIISQKPFYPKQFSIVSIRDKSISSNIKSSPIVSPNKNAIKLMLGNFQCPGDILMMTAAIRDLHKAYPEKYITDVRTGCPDIWRNNPYITRLSSKDPSVKKIRLGYDLIHRSNRSPYHFIHGFRMDLEKKLGLIIPATDFKGDIHLSQEEKQSPSMLEDIGVNEDFWIIISGGKFDYTAKWSHPDYLQEVVDYFKGKITFVQVGEEGHFHPKLQNVIDLRGKTDLRQLILLTYHSVGVVCPVTLLMHLAAAVETKQGKPLNRAGVIIAGGREPAQWEAYPHHRFLSTNGALDCCDDGGCWKNRCSKINDEDEKNNEGLCSYPVKIDIKAQYDKEKIKGGFCLPKCIMMIKPEDIIRNIEMYYEGGALKYNSDMSQKSVFIANDEINKKDAEMKQGIIELPQLKNINEYDRKFSVLVCCYGDFPQYSIRAVKSILNCKNRKNFDLLIGSNACCEETLSFLRKKYGEDEIDILIERDENINKDPMWRLLMEEVKTPYVLWCFEGRQKVETTEGAKNIRDIKIGDFVKTHKNRYRQVTKIYKNYYPEDKEILWIKTSNSTIKCTPDHPFLIKQKGWIKANEITKKDILLYPYNDQKDFVKFNCFAGRKGVKNEYKHYKSIEIDEDLARFFGLYLAEGCGGNDSIRFTFNNNEKEYIDFITKVCLEKFYRKPTIYKRWATCVKLNIRSFNKLFCEWFGKDATTKKIPHFIFNWNLKNKLHFILGYLQGDGHDSLGSLGFTTSSKMLCNDFIKLLDSCGLKCGKIHFRNRKSKFVNNKKESDTKSYSGRMLTDSCQKMYDLLEAKPDYNKEFLQITIKSIENRKRPSNLKDKYVYNLEVKEDNSYVVGPCVCHNCDDDSHMTADNWDEKFISFIEKNHPFECAGKLYFMGRDEQYNRFLESRKWFRGEDKYSCKDHKKYSVFATGGMFLVRTDLLKTHDFPDEDMIKGADDRLLGDLISQHKYKLIPFSQEIEKIIKISDGDRRGSDEMKI